MLITDLDRALHDRRRFLRYIGATPEEDRLACWLWEGPARGKPGHRYGVMGLKVNGVSITMYAHRLAVLFTDGECDDKTYVCHKCYNGLCVRRSHLYLGTPLQNAQDALRHAQELGRATTHPNAKLTVDQVREIRARSAQGETRSALAREFGVHVSVISEIARGLIWKHV